MWMLSRLRYTIWTPRLLAQDRQTGECLWHTPRPRRIAAATWRLLVKAKWIWATFGAAVLVALGTAAGDKLVGYLSDSGVQENALHGEQPHKGP